jgi:hypothetical protein
MNNNVLKALDNSGVEIWSTCADDKAVIITFGTLKKVIAEFAPPDAPELVAYLRQMADWHEQGFGSLDSQTVAHVNKLRGWATELENTWVHK